MKRKRKILNRGDAVNAVTPVTGQRGRSKQSSEASGGQRNQRSARKLDRKKVLELHTKGLSTREIAQHQGVEPSTVWRFLDRTQPQREALKRFKSGRADILADVMAKSLDAQERILESLDDQVLVALTPHQKASLLAVLSATTGTLYDKERLERGKSTENVSLMARMMGDAFDSAHKSDESAAKRSASQVGMRKSKSGSLTTKLSLPEPAAESESEG